MSQNIDSLAEMFLDNPDISGNFLHDIFLNIADGIVITDNKGKINFLNDYAKELLGNKVDNIRSIGYLFNFDICILDKNQDIISYSPITVALDSNIDTSINTIFEDSSGTEKQIIIYSKSIKDKGHLLIFSDKTNEKHSQSYIELSRSNEKLKDKIKENEQLRSQAQSQAIRESLVNRISTAIRNSLEIDTILQTAVDELGKTLGVDRTILLQNTADNKELPITHEFIAKNQKSLKGTTVKIKEDFFLQEVIDSHEVTTGNHIDKCDNENKNKLIVPVIHHDELFGMIVLIRSNRKWHSEEISLVQSIADQISVSIKNAKLFEDTASKNTKISVLNEILKSINSSLILDDVFYTIGREIKRLIHFDRASIAILDEDSRQVKLFARLTPAGEVDILRSGPLIAKGTAISWAIENLKPIKIDMTENKNFSDAMTLIKSGIKTAIIIPMVNKGNVTGIFYVGSKHKDVYSEAEVEIMSQIAGQIAVAVENAKLYWQTQTQALKETLINQIVSSIRKSLDLKEVLHSTVNELGRALAVNNCVIKYFLDGLEGNDLCEYCSKGYDSITQNKEEFFNKLIKLDSFKNEKIIIFQEAESYINTDIKDFMGSNKIKSMLLLPITFHDPISNEEIDVAVIVLTHSDINKTWTNDDINLLKVLSDQINITINQAWLFSQSQRQKSELESALSKLKKAQAQLVQSEKMAGLGQLVAGVAHEINTPIGSISSNNSIFKKCTEKLKNTLSADNPNLNKANQLLQMLEETTRFNSIACERINDIVKSLKNFARLDESELKKVDIHEGINSTLTLLRHELRDRIKIVTDFTELPEIECYPNLLNQVLMNLLVNSIQSIEDKGTITISTRDNSNHIEVSINDTGIGIQKEDLDKIFDPGFTTKGVGVGTGLGLSICYQIIEKHKGKITVESKAGAGSTFTVSIPKKQPS